MASRNSTNTPSVAQTLLAGGAAGGIESLLTYPTEYVKTQQQLLNKKVDIAGSPFKIFINTVRTHGFRPLYGGAGIFCISNASKNAVRFGVFDFTRRYLPTNPETGRTTPVGNLFAGLVAGIAESITVLTPGETLKTKLIDDRNRIGGQQYKNTISAARNILTTQGLAGFYSGVVAVTLKQSSNAVVRFTSYNFLLDQTLGLLGAENKAGSSAIAGAGAGIITVYCTMPMDNIKTKLQAIGATTKYSGSWDCLTSMIKEEGVLSLWKGTSPRLVRLTVSGAISFAVYEQMLLWSSRKFSFHMPKKVPALSQNNVGKQ
ncbi:mitochondrial carrier domain-containing protein [Bisporella sp. PMI_857]|nr:mitochondrial carrier domain-containing protein [Bisporella sp. PMI_857]